MKPTPALRTPIIEILQKVYPEHCLHHTDTADEIIKYLIKQDDWIPIVDHDLSALPDGYVWLTRKDGNVYHSSGSAVKTVSDKFHDMTKINYVVAWMPYITPKPYTP